MCDYDETGENDERWSPSEAKMEVILGKHKEWLESDSEKGKRADLSKADLSGADLLEADLSGANFLDADLSGARLLGADLSGADFLGADLSGADFVGADLSGAGLMEADMSGSNFRDADLPETDLFNANLSKTKLLGADLSEANFRDAELSGAELTGAEFVEADLQNASLGDTSGLQAGAVARANVSNATLPDEVAEFDGLKTVEEATLGARKLLISLGLACAYAALAISTPRPGEGGGRLLTLPFIEVAISPWGFHLAVPVLLAVGFSYLHIQLQRVWEEISRLPAVFPDGKAIDQKIHPWLITGLVRAHFPYLRENPIPLFRLQELVVIVLAWGIVPVTQAYFVGSFVAQFPEYAYQSGLGAALVSLTTIGAVVSYQTAKAHLRGEYEGLFRPFGDEEDESIRKQPNWHTVFLSIEWTLLIFALWIGWTFVL